MWEKIHLKKTLAGEIGISAGRFLLSELVGWPASTPRVLPCA